MNEHNHDAPTTWGLLAEFDNADSMVEATKRARAEGYTYLDAYSPFAVGEAADALGFPKSEMGTVMFIGGLVGACSGFFMQLYLSAAEYPLNVAGRPLNSWPQFIPITFEMGVLTAALTGLFTLMALCGLPQLYHPLFNVPVFERVNRDRFFIAIEAEDPKFDPQRTRDFLLSLQPLSVAEVPS